MDVTSLRVAFAGTPRVAVPALEALIDSNHEVVGVLSKPDAPAGRGRRLQPSQVSVAAAQHGLALLTPERINQQTIDQMVQEWFPDVVAVVAYGLLIPHQFVDVPRFGWVNAHFSSLPAWRGTAPVQHAIAHGDLSIAVTTFRIDEGLDTGPVLGRSEAMRIGEREDAGHLLAKLAPLSARLMVETMDGLAAGTLRAQPQSDAGVSYAPRISVQDARIDWRRPVRDVDRWIRACTPEPGAWTFYGEHRLRIEVPQKVLEDEAATPGSVLVEKSRVRVGAMGGYVVLDSVQPTGKKSMDAADWARGLRESAPESFDS